MDRSGARCGLPAGATEVKWRLLAAFTGLIALVLLAQDVPLASYLRDIERDQIGRAHV